MGDDKNTITIYRYFYKYNVYRIQKNTNKYEEYSYL